MFKRVLLVSLFMGILVFSLMAEVSYLHNRPKIEGIAAANLPNFKLQEFAKISKSNDDNPDIKAGYYYAYSVNFFYLYIEAAADSIIARDRAYQNGDGFHMVMGKKQKDNQPTDEFYVLGFSPQKSWCHKMQWYYNIDLAMKKLDDKVEFATSEKKGKISFELLLPWSKVKPYHPWFDKKIGFNLCFVKAIGKSEKNYYFVKHDERMQSEQAPREYIALDFAQPKQTTPLYALPTQGHIFQDQNLGLKISGFCRQDTTTTLIARVRSGENTYVGGKRLKLNLPRGIFHKVKQLKDFQLWPGGYKLSLENKSDVVGEYYVSVLPQMNIAHYKKQIRGFADEFSAGTINTLLFYCGSLQKDLTQLKPYETAYKIRLNMEELDNYLKQLQKNKNPLAAERGTYRRAFVSEIDSTLRPYSIYVPQNYEPEKKYPLLIYLHGSGDDDRVLQKTPKIEQDFIIVAPNGRGTSNCFFPQEAQTDIVEAITDVKNNFNIDSSNIILSGFSMGGYGAYKTYYEHSGLFKAIAIISGHPNLAQEWGAKGAENFFNIDNLKKFEEVPVFIYHGRGDLNCPFSLTQKLVDQMKKKEYDVTFAIGESGHGNMSKQDRAAYYDWLRKQVK